MQLKTKLAQSEITIGSWITLGHTAIAEIMASAGFDWLVLDMEHSVLELNEVQTIIQVLDGRQCPAIARLTSNHPDQIKRVMDAGATGVMVPMIKSAADAQSAVDAVFSAITAQLKKGGDVRLVGFGNFSVSKRAATVGRNPQTGAAVNIPARTVPKFSAGKGLKDAVN